MVGLVTLRPPSVLLESVCVGGASVTRSPFSSVSRKCHVSFMCLPVCVLFAVPAYVSCSLYVLSFYVSGLRMCLCVRGIIVFLLCITPYLCIFKEATLI